MFRYLFLLLFLFLFSCSQNKSDSQLKSSRVSKYDTKAEEKFDDPDEFMKLFAEVREGYTYGYRERELEIMKNRIRTSVSPDPDNPTYGTSAAATAIFNERGPRNVAGRTRTILIDVADASGNTWIAGNVGGGVWKTSDQGSTWTNLSPDMENIAVTTLAQSANNPQILYAGTGEGWVGNLDAIDGSGIFKSSDGGSTWSNITPLSGGELNPDFRAVSRAIADPNDANVLVVSASDKIYRTSDGGTTWSQVYDGAYTVMHVISAKSDFNIQYAAVKNEGIVKSIDAGLTWSSTANFPVTTANRMEIAASRTDPNKMYAAVVTGGYKSGKIIATTDGGTNWRTILDDTMWLDGQGWYDNIITVNPYDDNIIYVGGIDLWKFTIDFSTNTKTDTRVSDAYGNSINGFFWTGGVHPDQQFIDVIDDGGGNFRLLVGNDGGIDVSVSNSDPGTTNGDFTTSDIGYNTTQFYGADKVKGHSQYIGGAQDNGTWVSNRSEDASSTSDYSFGIGGDGFEVIAHWTDPDKMIGGSQNNGLYKTTNGGSTWTYFKDKLISDCGDFSWCFQFFTHVATSYQDPEMVYTVTSDGIFRSSDFANSFNLVTPSGGSWGFGLWTDIEPSLANPRYVWSGGWDDLYLSTDYGASFNTVPSYLSSRSGDIKGIYSHPTEDSTVYILFTNYDKAKIIETKDLGQTWSDITGFVSGSSTRGFPNVPTYCLAVMPYDTDVIWAGTDIGLVESTDRGLTWNLVQSNLPHVSIWDLKVKDEGQVVISTHGRGIWTATIPSLVGFTPKPVIGLAPELLELSETVNAKFNLRSPYDSLVIYVDGVSYSSFTTKLNIGQKVLEFDLTDIGEYDIQGIGYIDGYPFHSNIKSISLIPEIPARASYITDFSSLPANDFILDGFTVKTEPNFQSDHLINVDIPYNINTKYVAELRVPIIVNSFSPSIKFNEVAIVEPGDATGLWDYVVVQGRKKGSSEWTDLISKYDASEHTEWLSAYNLGSDGDSTLYKNREINFSPSFIEGDTVMVRFLLESDDWLVAWGWAIDDLFIQSSNQVPNKAKVHITASNDNFNDVNSISIGESGGIFNPVIITAHVDQLLSQDVSIPVAWSGSATYEEDYSLSFPYIDPSVLIIPAGVDSVNYFTLYPMNDEFYEGGVDGESIILDIDNFSSPYVEEAGESRVTITIADWEDGPVMYIESEELQNWDNLDTVNEGESTEFWATIAYPEDGSDEDIYFDVTYEGNAVKDVDYTSTSQRLTIPARAKESNKITINILTDNIVDDNEDIFINYSISGSNTSWTFHGDHGFPLVRYSIVIVDMTPLGVERIHGINKIYPIPADRVIKVDLQDNVNVEKVEFIDFLGKVYNNTKFTKNLNTVLINVSDYDAGVYILNIQTNKGLTKAKVIIER